MVIWPLWRMITKQLRRVSGAEEKMLLKFEQLGLRNNSEE